MHSAEPGSAPLDPTKPVAFESETHEFIPMTDKLRHRTRPAPHGFLPNWALVVLVAIAIAVVGLARSLI